MVILVSEKAVSEFLKSTSQSVTGDDIKSATWRHFAQRAEKEHRVHLCGARCERISQVIEQIKHKDSGVRALNIDTEKGFTTMIGVAKTFFATSPTCNH